MSAISRPAFRPRNSTKDFVILARATPTSPTGALVCGHCGSNAMAKGDYDNENGVPLGTTTKFLARKNLRPDLAAKVRAGAMKVVE